MDDENVPGNVRDNNENTENKLYEDSRSQQNEVGRFGKS